MMASVLVLPRTQRLTTVGRDYHAKRKVVYLVEERSGLILLLGQSLPRIVDYINTYLSSGDHWDRATVTGIFESIDRTDGRNGGWHKGRFRTRAVPIEEASDAFEAARADFETAAIVTGKPTLYHTVKVAE